MKKIYLFSLSALFMILSCKAYSQIYSSEFENFKIDTIITGKSYKILIYNGWETEGKVTFQDSTCIKVKSKIKEYTISKDQIVAMGEPSEDLSWDYETGRPKEKSYDCQIDYVSGEMIKNVHMLQLHSDTLSVANRYANMKVRVQDIKSIKFTKKSYFLPGLVAGAFLGGIIGYIAGVDNSDKVVIKKGGLILWPSQDVYGMNAKPLTAFVSAVCGALVIGGIGALLGIDDEYDFTTMTIDLKRNEIKN